MIIFIAYKEGKMKIREIAIDNIKPNPKQPRQFIDQESLRQLAKSIEKKGLLEEILVRPKDDYFEIVHGERRWRACNLLGLKTIKAKIRELSDEETFELSLIENIQRENLLPIEEARAYKKLADKGKTHEEIAKRVDKSRTYVTQKLRILKLPIQVIRLLTDNKLSEGQVKQLLRLEDIIGTHENLKKADPVFVQVLNIGKHPFKSWVAYYQDYYAWHYSSRPVSELKDLIDKFYFDMCSAMIFQNMRHQLNTLPDRKSVV